MFNDTVSAQLKTLAKEKNTTQGSLANALVEYALARVTPEDVAGFALETAKPRGRPVGSKNAPKETAETPVVADAAPVSEDAAPGLFGSIKAAIGLGG